MFDIQTDPSFPAFATDAEPESLQAEETMMRQNEVVDILSQFPPTLITDATGKEVLVLGQPQQEATTATAWGLLREKSQWFLQPGRIFTSPSASKKTRVNLLKTAVAVTAGQAIWIELSNSGSGDLLASIKSGPLWEGHPEPYTINSQVQPHAITYARFILWEFESGKPPATETEAVELTPGIYGVPARRADALYITWGAAPNSADKSKGNTPRRYIVPVLLGL